MINADQNHFNTTETRKLQNFKRKAKSNVDRYDQRVLLSLEECPGAAGVREEWRTIARLPVNH